MEYPSLKGKIAIVTGAGSGIGAAIAKKLAKSGTILSLIDVQSEAMNAVAEECVQLAQKFNNPKPFLFVGDLTKDEIREEYVENTVKHFGRLDILVNNAGIATPCSIFDPTMETADKLFSILLRATYDMCRLSIKHLISSTGCIVNIASVCGSHPVAVNPAYNTSKAGVIHLTRCIADELGCHNVRVNSVSPGVIDTNIAKNIMAQDVLRKMGEAISPMGRFGLPEEVANTVAFLVSDQSSYMSGSNVLVDGAMLAKRLVELPK